MRGIIGNTVGTPMPRTNYNQTNPKKADYLVGRENILGKDELTSATEEALRQAKESGEFDGADGVSCTHSWNGTTLTVTSASGTSSADLKGEKGDPGEGASGGVIITCNQSDITSPFDTLTLPEGITFQEISEAGASGNIKIVCDNGDPSIGEANIYHLEAMLIRTNSTQFIFSQIRDRILKQVTVGVGQVSGRPSAGNMVLSGGVPICLIKTQNASTVPSVTISPNQFYCFTAAAVTSLSITLGTNSSYSSNAVCEYRFRFTSGSTPTTLSLPASVIGAFVPEANKTYEVSIIDNYLSYKSWPAN